MIFIILKKKDLTTKKIGEKIYLSREQKNLKIAIDQRASSLQLLLIALWFLMVLVAGFMIIPEYLRCYFW